MDSKNIKITQVTFEQIEDDVEPPPPHLTSNFNTLQDWLFNICDNEKPQKVISTYNFGLYQSPNNNVIFLVGLNNYTKGQSAITRIEFQPSDMYFQLPAVEYKNLNPEQLVNKLTAQLKDFTNTEKFQHSFLANAKSITTNFKFKEDIWSK